MYPSAPWPLPRQLSCSGWLIHGIETWFVHPLIDGRKNDSMTYLHLQGRAGDKVVPVQSGKEVSCSPISLYADDQDKSILFNFLDKEIYYKPWPEISYFCLLFSTIFPFCFTLALLLLFTSLNTRHHAITQNVLQMFIHTWSGGVFRS